MVWKVSAPQHPVSKVTSTAVHTFSRLTQAAAVARCPHLERTIRPMANAAKRQLIFTFFGCHQTDQGLDLKHNQTCVSCITNETIVLSRPNCVAIGKQSRGDLKWSFPHAESRDLACAPYQFRYNFLPTPMYIQWSHPSGICSFVSICSTCNVVIC